VIAVLTHIHVRNFKKFEDVSIELGKAVVLIGPNNSGKSTALQALALWELGLRRWQEKRTGQSSPEKRPGVAINRKDLISVPVPDANLLWRDLHVRNVQQTPNGNGKSKPKTQNIRIDIQVDGVSEGKEWRCGLEFDYANEESFYCRALRLTDEKDAQRMPVPPEASKIRVAFLPPMSGLAAVEPKWEPGRINVLIGEGQTAQVLRNLCYQIHTQEERNSWDALCDNIKALFGVTLLPPAHLTERGEISLAYKEPNNTRLDLSSSGRGMQQTLLLLTHLYAHPGTVLLLDEPDAHLEVLRQRQIYELLTRVADERGSQVIIASHSEVLLNEAAGRDVVIAFVGEPHRIDNRKVQVAKSLSEIGFEHYYQSEQTGWVLYLEGSSDLAILKTFAKTLAHPAQAVLEQPYVDYVSNQPNRGKDRFWGLREAFPDLIGVALFDRLDKELRDENSLRFLQWRRREIENYLCMPEVLLAYAKYQLTDDLFGQAEGDRRVAVMKEEIDKLVQSLANLGRPDPWSADIKASDDFLDPLFRNYFKRLGLPNIMNKSDYHVLAGLVPKDKIDPEVVEKLDAIYETARRAKPRADG
jgi:ABC-type lipoprotein export system ATPase subunit